jgi:amidase
MNFVDRFRDIYEEDPNALGSNVRNNYEMGARMTLSDVAWAHAEQTRIFRRFQHTFHDYDLVFSPTTSVTPFPWTEFYPEEMNGKPMHNYYHWVSLTYVITLATNPAISLPCGLDHAGMPFGIQIVGRFRGDRVLLGTTHSLEQAIAGMPQVRRPIPDLGSLSAPLPALRSIVTHPPTLDARTSAAFRHN